MQDAVLTESAEGEPRVSEFQRFLRVFFSRKVVLFGIIVILVLIITAIFAPLIAPYDPYETNLKQVLDQPSWEHLLGTDNVGRDVLSRIIYGAQTSLLVGLLSVGFAAIIGITLGLVAGYFGGIINMIIMRFVDALMAFPPLLIALLIVAVLSPGVKNVTIALGISFVPTYARLMCGQVLTCKEADYVTAVRAIGASDLRIMLRHIFPNCIPPLIVSVTLMLGAAILLESGLSFLGIGIVPPTAAWGGMIATGYKYILTVPVYPFMPGLAIMLIVLSLNLVGDGLRDALDPRLRGTL